MSHHHTAEQLADCTILQDQRQRSFCLRSRSSSVEQLVDKAGLSAVLLVEHESKIGSSLGWVFGVFFWGGGTFPGVSVCCVYVCLLVVFRTILLMVVFSQLLGRYHIPCFIYTKHTGCQTRTFQLFKMFPVRINRCYFQGWVSAGRNLFLPCQWFSFVKKINRVK